MIRPNSVGITDFYKTKLRNYFIIRYNQSAITDNETLPLVATSTISCRASNDMM